MYIINEQKYYGYNRGSASATRVSRCAQRSLSCGEARRSEKLARVGRFEKSEDQIQGLSRREGA